jgi:BtpA family
MDGVQSAKDLRLRGLADALIISGSETGAAPAVDRLSLLRAAVDAPILIGSGLAAENTRLFAAADGAIVGTSIKRQGRVTRRVDRKKGDLLSIASGWLASSRHGDADAYTRRPVISRTTMTMTAMTRRRWISPPPM